jgi:hypothetical protein
VPRREIVAQSLIDDALGVRTKVECEGIEFGERTAHRCRELFWIARGAERDVDKRNWRLSQRRTPADECTAPRDSLEN